MLFKKAKSLYWQHMLLIGLICAAISLLVTAAMVVVPSYVLEFATQNSLFFIEPWIVAGTFVLAIAAQFLVIFGPAFYYAVLHNKVGYGTQVLFCTLVMEILLMLIVIAVCYFIWGEPYVVEDLVY